MKANDYPWYDSLWLSAYTKAKDLLEKYHPDRLADFVDAMDVLKTRSNFEAVKLDGIFDDSTIKEIKNIASRFESSELEKDELLSFGRQVVHRDARFTKLQENVTGLVSEIVGEAVEPGYNFLSLYNNLGVLPVHMDAPPAKWTLDYCIEQSEVWSIYLSQVRPWPEDFEILEGQSWEQQIRDDPENKFTEHRLHEGEAIVFGGSSQWHYRDRIIKKQEENFCHLLFFHFIPKGTKDLVNPKKWAEFFGIPELKEVAQKTTNATAYSLEELVENNAKG